MSFKAKIFIEGQERNILNASIIYAKFIDANGKPTTGAMGQGLNIRVESTGNDEFFYNNMFSPTSKCRGEIIFYKRDGLSILFKIEFANAQITSLSEHFNAVNNMPLYIDLVISWGIMRMKNIIFQKPWNPNNPFTNIKPTVINREEEEPEEKEPKKEETEYKLDKKGHITRVDNIDGTKYDILYTTDKGGTVDKSKSIRVAKENAEDSTIISELAVGKTDNKGKKINFATTKNIKDALDVFQFAAYNSNVEWGVYGSTKDGGTFALGTYQSEDKSPVFSGTSFNLGFTNSNVKFDIHSHVGRFATEGPSGSTNPKKGDLGQERTKMRFRYIYYMGHGRSTPKGTLFIYGKGSRIRDLGEFRPTGSNTKSLASIIKL